MNERTVNSFNGHSMLYASLKNWQLSFALAFVDIELLYRADVAHSSCFGDAMFFVIHCGRTHHRAGWEDGC